MKILATVDISGLTRDGDHRALAFTDELGRTHRAFVLLYRDSLRAFVNRCPHWSTPLDEQGGPLFDPATHTLICQTHGARFLPDDGLCISGPCSGEHLQPLAIHPTDDPQRIALTRPGLQLA
jgi:nitrite reductase/ring-hydroxylating ferredoxin subunit